MATNPFQRVAAWLQSRSPGDEEYVETCRKWLRRERMFRIFMLICVAIFMVALALMGMKFSVIVRLVTNTDAEALHSTLGFLLGAMFGGTLYLAIWGLVLAIRGFPQKRIIKLMLRFHDELKGDGVS